GRRGRRGWVAPLVAGLCLLAGLCAAATAAGGVLGDLDGDGDIDATDLAWILMVYDTGQGAPAYDGGGDLNADGVINFQDLALLGGAAGQTPSPVGPATVFFTADNIPDDFNDLLVLPPDGFTLDYTITNPAGAPLIDTGTLNVTADRDAGPLTAGTNLGPLFTAGPSAGSWQVDASHAFPARNVDFAFQVANLAGALVQQPSYQVAVRDWKIPVPIGAGQTVFLDLAQDRDLIGGVDFEEDLREFGLGSLAAPLLSATARDLAIARILAAIRAYHGQNSDGSPGPDAVTVAFTETSVAGATRICVGGEDPLGGTAFGFTPFDLNNAQTGADTCFPGSPFGVFPREFLFFSGNLNFQAVFDPLRPAAGGVPVGADPLDAIVLATGFDPQTALPAELARWNLIDQALTTFANFVATIAAHETGHTLGLTANGAVPGGLSGDGLFHNLTSAGGTPATNWIMNAGSSFTYEEIVGAAGESLPRFRPLSDAYLRNRLELNGNVTGFFTPPVLTSVTCVDGALLPIPCTYTAGSLDILIAGSGFFGTPTVLLLQAGFPARLVQNVTVLDPNTVRGTLFEFQVGTGTFDVQVTNPDDQVEVLPASLTVIP
ncbi:MAG: dockerin type I domain-containing protein, partial [Myxococcota bacterium]